MHWQHALPKKVKTKSNALPIGLTLSEALILAEVFTHRLQNTIPAVRSEVHIGYVKGRHSFLKICSLLDIIHTATKDTGECDVFIDAEEICDRVEWVYLWAP